jgi:cobalamin synthase
MNVDAVQAVVPAEGTITVRTNRRTRIALLRHDPRRGPTAVVARTAVSAARIMWMTSVLALTSLASAVGWTARGLRTNVPVLAALAGRTSASAATWARPHGRTLARLTGAAVITVALFVLALAHALAAAIAAYARFVAHEWARRRSGRMTPFS